MVDPSAPLARRASRPTRSQRAVLVVAILSSFVAFLDASIVNVALPAITDELGGGLAVQQWVVDAYLLTLGAFILLAGSLSDAFGRVRILAIGLVVFGITSVLCAVAPTDWMLIVARALQGAAGALLVPSSLALIISTFKGASQARAIGVWTAWTGTATILGPLLGGILVDFSSWRLVFLINVAPIALVLWLLRGVRADASAQLAAEHPSGGSPAPRPRIDGVGAALGAVGLGGPVFALIEQSRFGWASPVVWVPLAVGVLSFAAFIWWESRTRSPMMPLDLFRIRNFSAGNLATVFIYAALSLAFFILAIYLQQVVGWSAFFTGLASLPPTLVMLVLSSRTGALAGRIGPRLFMTVGPIVAAGGFLLLLTVGDEVNYWWNLLPGLLVFGVGLAITVAPLTSAILASIDESRAGIGSAVNNAVSRVAGLVAIAAASVIVGPMLDLEGFHRAMIAAATMLVIGGIVSFVGIRNSQVVAT